MYLNINIIKDYENLQSEIKNIIVEYDIHKTDLKKLLNIDFKTLDKKIKENKFSIQEMYLLANYLNNKLKVYCTKDEIIEIEMYQEINNEEEDMIKFLENYKEEN